MTAILNDAPAQLQAAQDQFELVKREAIGRIVGAINSVEAIANQYDGPLFDGATIFDELTTLEGLTFTDILPAAEAFLGQGRQTVYTILP